MTLMRNPTALSWQSWPTWCPAAARIPSGAPGCPGSTSARDIRMPQSSPESGGRAGYDGHKHHTGTEVLLAVDTLGQLLVSMVTPANEQDRAQVGELAKQIQEATGDSVEVAFVDQGYTGDQPAAAAEAHSIRLEVVKLPTAKRGFVLLPRRWVVERSFAWMARFRCLVRDYERLAETLVGLHFAAFAVLMAHQVVAFMMQSA
jgi:transposase